ncbi:MAG TPA: mucoidy inhibitor MuiA family protein [Acetobacteraceae bacterium]|nr:mucoidy inhibitor MuiA family protein [Acetobacteraceae bacterium]
MIHRRRAAAAAFALLLAAAYPALAQEVRRIEVTVPPGAVTVFPAQAAVTRTARIELPAGDSLLVIGGVPTGILADSVTARGQATAPVAIGAVELRQASFDPAATNQRRAALESAIRGVEDRIAEVDVRIAAYAAQASLVERLAGGFVEAQRRPPQPGQPAPRLAEDPAAWRAAIEATRQATEEAAEGTRRARMERRAFEERRAALQAELQGLGARPRGALEIAVAVSAERATMLEIAVTYQVNGASWRPVYEARLDSTAGRLLLRQEAVVRQATGEDWSDVTLTLSTARPAQGAQPPQLAPWRIGLVDLAALARERAMSMAPPAPVAAPMPQRAAPAGAADVAQEQRQEAQAVAAAVASAGFAVEYQIPGRATIRADNSERRVRIADFPAEATLSARAVPRLDRRAFLQARFANPSRTPTLPGQAALYLDGVFVGRVALPLLRPDEEATLSFGADDRIRVTHEPQAQRRANEGGLLTGRTQTRTADFIMTVRSFHTRPIEVTLLDQAPVSGDADLTVAITADPQPSARDVEDRPGVLAWTMTLQPNQERRVRFGYTVTAPRDRTITGLER